MDLSKYLPRVGNLTSGGSVASDTEFALLYPILAGFLTEIPGGLPATARTATLTIFAEDGVFKVRLSDRNTHYDLWASGVSVTEALKALERLFDEPVIPWRRNRFTAANTKAK
jgi:hypothetical protein